MELPDILCEKVRERQVVALYSRRDPEGQSRLVEPHAVYISSNSRGFVDFWQLSGWSWSGDLPGWRRVALTDIMWIEPASAKFTPRSDYHPDNRQWYRAFVCSAAPLPSGADV